MLWWTLRQLRSSKPRARASAARQLSASRDARAFAALSGAALEDRDATVRLSATKALAALENPSAIAPLLHLALADPIDSVRQAAATNLPQVDAFIAGVKSGQISGEALEQQAAMMNQMVGAMRPPGPKPDAEPTKDEPEVDAKPEEGSGG